MTSRDYWTIDTEFDAAHSIEAAASFIKLVERKPHYWKWFVLALHSGLQGALTLALNNDNTVLVQRPGVSRKMLAAFESQQEFPSPYMDTFLGLYSKAKDSVNLRQGAIPLPKDPDQARAITALDEMRDEFVHFNSKTWSIEKIMLIECPLTSCEVLEHLLERSHAIRWHRASLSTKAVRTLRSVVASLRDAANKRVTV